MLLERHSPFLSQGEIPLRRSLHRSGKENIIVAEQTIWIRRMPMPRRIDAILKRERALELLSKRAERVIGGFGRQLGQQNKVIQVNAITQVLNSQLATGNV